MTDNQTFAWIFLSVPRDGGALKDIIAMADAINHAIPSHRELQMSLGWLRARGLITKDGKCFALTGAGSQLLLLLGSPGRTMMEAWDVVADELAKLDGDAAPPEDFTFDEMK